MSRAIRTLARTLVRQMLAGGYRRDDIVDLASALLDELIRQGGRERVRGGRALAAGPRAARRAA